MAITFIDESRAEGNQVVNISVNGKSEYTVVTSRSPSPSEYFAAEELIKYIEQISAARLHIRKGGDLPGNALLVCEKSNLGQFGELFSELDVAEDEYAIIAKESRVFLIGGRGRSTLYAVYDFLDRLGCRWLAPNYDCYQGSGEFVPKKSVLSISLPPITVEKPAFKMARGIGVEEARSHNEANLAQTIDWVIKSRLNTLTFPIQTGRTFNYDNVREKVLPELLKRDMVIEVGGHGWDVFLNSDMEGGRLFELHPEWFGMDENGVRRSDKDKDSYGRIRIFCTSNPDAMEYFTANVVRYLKDRPEIDVFVAWPPDWGFFCECEKCKSLGNSSDRQGLVLNRLYVELTKLRPGISLSAAIYSNYEEAPTHVKYDRNHRMDFAPGFQNFEFQINDPKSPENARYVGIFNNWRKAFDGHLAFYSFHWRYVFRDLPMLIPHYLQNELQYFCTIPASAGMMLQYEPGCCPVYELNYYMLGQLTWNPSADVDKLVSRFADARYGQAGEAAVRVFRVLEDVVRRCCSISLVSLKSADEIEQARMKLDAAAAELSAARSLVSDPAVRLAVDRLLLSVDYARRDMDIQKSRAAKLPVSEIRRQVKSLAEFLHRHKLKDNDGLFWLPYGMDYKDIRHFYGIGRSPFLV